MSVGITVVVKMLVAMGMLVVVGMAMGVLMGMDNTVVGLLVGVCVGMFVAVAANMIVSDMHRKILRFFFYYTYKNRKVKQKRCALHTSFLQNFH